MPHLVKHGARGTHESTVIAPSLTALLDGLIEDVPVDSLRPALDELLRARSVQGLAPSAAVSFVFDLKRVMRQALPPEALASPCSEYLLALDNRIDRLGLAAFDVYVGLREQIFDLRVKDVQRQTAWWLRKARPADGSP